jgi:spermidine/putrescine ABC transporter ATP-binding subunit
MNFERSSIGARPPQLGGAPAVRLENISHRYGSLSVLEDVSLEVRNGEFLTLLGQSGSGKSTLLRIIAGLTAPIEGRILINGRDMSRVPTQRRGVGFVFQNYALFPHLTVFENLAYPLRIRSVSQPEIARRVDEVLERVNLETYGGRYPAQLSGGQQQRIAVARALVYEPAVLLMDEPLGALDRKFRKHMQIELRQLQQDLRISCVYVTHDQEEALTMSDRIALLKDGRILQIADPSTIYRHPVSSFVADFIGSTNLFDCSVRETPGGATLVTRAGTVLPVAMAGVPPAQRYHVAVRPERVRIDGSPTDVRLDARIEKVTFVGNVIDIACVLDNGEVVDAEISGGHACSGTLGQRITIGWDLTDMSVFPQV